MKIPALRMRQGEHQFYLAGLPVTFFGRQNDRLKADLFQAEAGRGYQRRATSYRVKDFVRHIRLAKGICPTAVVLNVRDGRTRFEAIRKGEDFGYLTVPDEATCWIVDGQHRIDGLRELIESGYDRVANLEGFKMATVIMQEETQCEEAKQFLIINKTQKGVKADLAEKLIAAMAKADTSGSLASLPRGIAKDIEWRPRAGEIVEYLNESETGEFDGNPWVQRIRLPNEPRGTSLVSQKAFEDSLKPLLNDGLLRAYDANELAMILVRFWRAVMSFCPAALRTPHAYVIQKTTGMCALHRIVPRVVTLVGRDGPLTQEGFQSVLQLLGDAMDDAYWASSGRAGLLGGSRKSIALIVSELSEPLEAAALQGTAAKPYSLG